MSETVLTLLSGTSILLNEIQTVVLPEVLTLEPGSSAVLENELHEKLGYAEIAFSKTETFALLQKEDLYSAAHADMGSWPNAYALLQAQVPGFSQSDKVTVVAFVVTALVTPGLTIGGPSPATTFSEADPLVEAEEEAVDDLSV